MTWRARLGVALIAGFAPCAGAQDEAPPGSAYEGKAFEFREIRDGVYHVVGTGALAHGCNGAVVVNENDVLVVDSHMTPAAAWALRRELTGITPKPIRYVVNTHFHFDHVHGNQIFGAEVEIIGHEFTREEIVSGRWRQGIYEGYLASAPDRIEELSRQITAEEDAQRRQELQAQRTQLEGFLAATDTLVATPPTSTLAERMTLYRGGREIRLLFLGRGHTGGDVVVHLPKEKILVTGDLITSCLPFMGDGHLAEWGDTLDRVKELDFDWILPGHGDAFRDRARVTHLQAYVRDLWVEASRAWEKGIPAEKAARQIDMTRHAAGLPCIDGPGVSDDAVRRVYEQLSARR